MFRSEIIGLGSHLPEQVITNNDLEKMMDTSDEWITKRTGIKERRWVKDGVNGTDLAKEACDKAIADAKLEKEDIDLVVYATLSPDHFFPGDGCFLAPKLGLKPGTPTLDIRQQCTGFMYGMSVADQFLRSGMYKNVLVVGSELQSRGLHKETEGRDVTVLFGDGAGAVVMSRKDVTKEREESCIWSTHLWSDGTYAKELWVEAPGSACEPDQRISAQMVEDGRIFPKMNGKKVYVHALKGMGEAILTSLEANQLKLEDIDLFLFHQANLRINEAVGEKFGIPADKIHNTIQHYGNTTAATLPIGMDDARKSGKLKKGDLVAMAAFGSGFTWAGGVFRY